MVYLVLEMLASGETAQSIIKNAFPKLTKKHIEAALAYAAMMAERGYMIRLPKSEYAFFG